MNHKASLAFYDVLVSLLLFFIVFGAFLNMQEKNRITANESMRELVIYSRSSVVFEQLTKFSGYPKDWTALNVSEIGIVSKPYVIDKSKLSLLSSMGYDNVKVKLKMPSEFVITIDGSANFSLGQEISNSEVYIFKRNVLYDDNIVLFTLKVFQ